MEKLEKSEEVKSVEGKHAADFIQALIRARKNLRLYPTNNPIYIQTVAEIHKKLFSFFDYRDSFDISIMRNKLLLGEETIYLNEGKDDNLALMLFRDGLRQVSFKKGITQEEFQMFLEVLSVDFDSEEVEEDIITLLWEKDFQYIKYKVDESTLTEDEDYPEVAESQAKEGASTEEGLQSAHTAAEEEPPSFEGIVPITVSDEDLKHLEAEIEREKLSKLPKLTEILFEMLYSSETMEEFKDISKILTNAVEFCVRHENLMAAIGIFRQVGEIITTTESAEVKGTLRQVLTYAGSRELVSTIGKWLDSKQGINEAVYKDYVALLEGNAIPQFIELLGTLESISGRKAAIYALSTIGKKDLNALAEGMKDPRWFVVRNVLVVLRNLKDRKAIELAQKALAHEEPRVKKEAMKLLGEMGGHSATTALVEQMYSQDFTVSIVAAQALSQMATETAKAALMEKIMSREFQDLDLSHMKPFFEALSKYRSKETYEFFMSMIEKNPLFGRTKFNELKACAVYGLGLLGSPRALPVLEELKESKIKAVSEHALMSIKRIQNVNRKQG